MRGEDHSGQMQWQIDDATASLQILYRQRPLMQIALAQLAVIDPGPVSVRHWLAWDFFRYSPRHVYPMTAWRVVNRSSAHGRIVLSSAVAAVEITLDLDLPDPWHMTIACQTSSALSFLKIVWQTSEQERWVGFGEHGRTIMPPARFDSWVEEGPVGFGPLSFLVNKYPFAPFPKGPYPSYASLPLWLSSQGYSAWFDSFALIRWRLAPRTRSGTIWDSRTVLHVVAGCSPEEIFRRQFQVLGPPKSPPKWAFFPWNDSIQGETAAMSLARSLRNHRIPSAVIWIEDWMGSWQNRRRFWMRPLSHRVDTALYPDLKGLSAELHRQGYRLLGYLCPEITADSALFDSAKRSGVLVKDRQGLPLLINILGIQHGQIDFTHPKAQDWAANNLLGPACDRGFDGWMADFGEYLPVRARLADGSTGWQSHNRYPLLWQQANARFGEDRGRDDDWLFFVRSGWIGSHALAPVVWGGDSDTDFEAGDGLPTVIPQVLSAQTAGFFYWATDIAGYMTFGLTRPATKALFWRWLQLAAVLPIMRTHHGTAAPRNWRFDKDDETLEVYTRYARLHASLYPYFQHLLHTAQQGIPIIRPLYLQFPDDQTAWTIDQQFMIGDGLLAAPVTTRRRSRHRFYLPVGRWRSWWTGQVYQGPGWIAQAVPLDRLPLFLRDLQVVPLLEGIPKQGRMEGLVDSCLPIVDGPGVALEEALPYLALYGSCGEVPFDARIFLIDGGVLTISYQPARNPDVSGSSVALPTFASHLPQRVTVSRSVELGPGQSIRLALADGWVQLNTSADCAFKRYILRFWPGSRSSGGQHES
ncbi:MAG: glycoside hydrolase [Thermaerobacter sp.]|nr:glycoside hydrolase [Thermaerobacter sp.]